MLLIDQVAGAFLVNLSFMYSIKQNFDLPEFKLIMILASKAGHSI